MNRRHGSLQSGEKMKKMYVVSSLMLSLGIFLANGCEDGTEPAPAPSADEGKDVGGKGDKGKPATVEGHKWQQIELTGKPSPLAPVPVVLAEGEKLGSVASIIPNSIALTNQKNIDEQNTKLFVVSGDKVIFAIDAAINNYGALKPEELKANPDLKKLARGYVIEQLSYVQKNGDEKPNYVHFYTKDVKSNISKDNAHWVVNLENPKMVFVDDAAFKKDYKLAVQDPAAADLADAEKTMGPYMSSDKEVLDKSKFTAEEVVVAMGTDKSAYMVVGLKDLWLRTAAQVPAKAE